MMTRSVIFLVPVLLAMLCCIAGCHAKMSGLPIGKTCTVQFRRDFLGAANELPVAPTANSINGAETCVTGKLLRVTDEWVVVQVFNYDLMNARKEAPSAETWIPRSGVLLIQFESKFSNSR